MTTSDRAGNEERLREALPPPHLTDDTIDAMIVALGKTFPIYANDEAGTDIDGDAVTVLDALVNAGFRLTPSPALAATPTQSGAEGATLPWDRPTREGHVQTPEGPDDYCTGCGELWPCSFEQGWQARSGAEVAADVPSGWHVVERQGDQLRVERDTASALQPEKENQ
jgi:hypothetical protein